MSESNNNVPIPITQLQEATAYEDGMYYAVAKAGGGTKKINAGIVNSEIEKVKKYFEVVGNYFDVSNLQNGYYLDDNGAPQTTITDYNITDFIEVEEGETYYYVGTWGNTIHLYDSNRNHIEKINSAPVTIPTGVKYIRTTIQNMYLTAAYFIKGSSAVYPAPSHNIELKQEHLPEVPSNKVDTSGLSIDFNQVNDFPLNINVINLFDKTTVADNTYVSAQTGEVLPLNGYFSSDFIDLNGLTTVTVCYGFINVFYDENKAYITNWSGGTEITINIPEGARFFKTCAANDKLNILQVGANVSSDNYIPYGKAEINNVLIYEDQIIKEKGSGTINGYEVEFLLPDTIYLRPNEDFSIYYNGAIRNYFALDDNYFVGQAKKTGNTYSAISGAYDYKWHYTPAASENFSVEFRIIEKSTGIIVTSKVVNFITSAVKTGKSLNAVIIGDSFVDGYNIVPYLVQMIEAGGNTLNSLGLNSTDFQGIKDNGYAGLSYYWVTNSKQSTALRSDRPLDQAYWDEGWGEGEQYGWHSGDTYQDLTPEQRSHGHTKNELFNPTTNKFDLSYYMTNFYPNETCNVLISEYGLNDIGWGTIAECEAKLPDIKNYITEIITSAKAYNANIKVVLYTIVSNAKDDNSIGSWWPFSDNSRVQTCCDLFNKMILENFANDANVIIIPSSANFDNRYGIKTQTYKPVKFDQSIEEICTSDIHPTVIGSKYIADSMANVVYNLFS